LIEKAKYRVTLVYESVFTPKCLTVDLLNRKKGESHVKTK